MEKIEIGNATLYHGDCFNVLESLEDGSIDNVISDPPYATESFGKCTACEWDKPVPLNEFWKLIQRKTKPSANIVLFGNMKLAYDLIDTNKEGFRYDLVWAKNNRVGFFNANLQPLRSHENVLLFCNKPGNMLASTYNPQKTYGGRLFVERTATRKEGGVYPPRKAYTSRCADGMTHPHSILSFDHDRGCNLPEKCLHPTMKPLQLLRWLILSYSNPGDVILDPFMGSCTTGEAAVRLGRRFIGIERERQYFDISCRRLEAIQQEANLLPDDIDTEGITAKAS